MENIELKVWFSKLDISNKNKLQLLNDFGNIKNIWNTKEKEFKLLGYDASIIYKIFDKCCKINLEREVLLLENEKAKIISILDVEYPNRLKEIANSPVQIYIKGDMQKLYDDNIGIIGSRNASEYGKNISRQISNELSSLNINIVSGLAVRNRQICASWYFR